METNFSSSGGAPLLVCGKVSGGERKASLPAGLVAAREESAGGGACTGATRFIYHGVKISTMAMRANARRVFLSIYLGRGSTPPLEKGWHFKMRRKVNQKALKKG